MSSIDSPAEGMTSVHCEKGKCLTIVLENVIEFKKKHPDKYDAIIECTSFVNWRRIEAGEEAVLALSFNA